MGWKQAATSLKSVVLNLWLSVRRGLRFGYVASIDLLITNHASSPLTFICQSLPLSLLTNHLSRLTAALAAQNQGQSMQNPGVLWFMIKQWQIGDQIQDQNR